MADVGMASKEVKDRRLGKQIWNKEEPKTEKNSNLLFVRPSHTKSLKMIFGKYRVLFGAYFECAGNNYGEQ